MDLDLARRLTSPEGRRLLAAARETRGRPAHARPGALATLGPPALVRAALAQDDLRRRARARCPHAEDLLFTREALEQATAWPVALDRAARWPGPPGLPLADLGAGIGLDALAAAATGRPVEAWERDPVRAHLLRANAEARGLARLVTVREGDVLDARPRPGGPLVFLDPARRPGGRRTRAAERFEPPLASWEDLLRGFESALVKLPPRGEAPLEGPIEVVSLDGRLRETRLRLGAWAVDRPPRRALSLPSGRGVEGPGRPWPAAEAPEEGAWLLDPDPAVTVAGLVGDLAGEVAGHPLHPRIAYLQSEMPTPDAPGTWLRIEAVLRARPKALNAWLGAQGVGRLTLRLRGIDDPVEVWRKRLRPRGDVAGTLVLTRDRRDRWIALAGRESPAPFASPPRA